MSDTREKAPFSAEQAETPHDPRLTAYEAGRWYALHGRSYPAGATRECVRGWTEEYGLDYDYDTAEEVDRG